MSLHVAAKHLASKGRDGDTELVHMTKGEIGGLQALALAHGGSLSINPDTGLVEASFLKRILPMVAGAGLMMIPGVGPLAAAGMVGGFETMRTGDIGKGLMAGLGAYGGAGLAGSLASTGASAANTAATEATLAANKGNITGSEIAREMGTAGFTAPNLAANANPATMTMADKVGAGFNQITSTPQALGAFGKQNLMNIGAAAAPALGDAMTPKGPPIPGMPEEDPRYAGSPYRYNLAPGFQGSTPIRPSPYYRPTGLGYAKGGEVDSDPDAFLNFVRRMGMGLAGMGIASGGKEENSSIPTISPEFKGSFARQPEKYHAPTGLGYAEGGNIMMAAGGSFDDEPMGDDSAMAAGGIAAYAEGGKLEMKRMSLGEGMYRDTDEDTASLGAYDAAMKRMEKQFAAGNLKPRAMPKSGIAKLGQMKTMASGGLGGYSDGGRMLKGPGDGMSDSIPATIGKRQPARLADGEFVVPADVVSHLGNGSTDAGARKLYSMMDKVRTARTGKKKQAPAVKTDKFMPA